MIMFARHQGKEMESGSKSGRGRQFARDDQRTGHVMLIPKERTSPRVWKEEANLISNILPNFAHDGFQRNAPSNAIRWTPCTHWACKRAGSSIDKQRKGQKGTTRTRDDKLKQLATSMVGDVAHGPRSHKQKDVWSLKLRPITDKREQERGLGWAGEGAGRGEMGLGDDGCGDMAKNWKRMRKIANEKSLMGKSRRRKNERVIA
ncbi:hypothetical protein DFH11DRAFT_1541635 [Phellopilus nigrolimitatus]|nr:hypothetical protein DFH11DRAFT_1541635 [Phellopilus nigrolimitatus]